MLIEDVVKSPRLRGVQWKKVGWIQGPETLPAKLDFVTWSIQAVHRGGDGID